MTPGVQAGLNVGGSSSGQQVGLSIFGPVFRGVRALMYNSFEERAMIQAASGNDAVPHVVVGVMPPGFRVPGTPRVRNSGCTRSPRDCRSACVR